MYVCINMMYLILNKIFEFILKQDFQYMHGIINYIPIKVCFDSIVVYWLAQILEPKLFSNTVGIIIIKDIVV
jgi:hypothetical protein